jgi:hypothetical protein
MEYESQSADVTLKVTNHSQRALHYQHEGMQVREREREM